MKWWCFNEEQLEKALAEYVEIAASQTGHELMASDADTVRHFLYSEFARVHKLRGDRE